MKENRVLNSKVIISLGIVLAMLAGILPFSLTEAATAQGYLILVEEKDGSWSEYEGFTEVKAKNQLMVNGSEVAGILSFSYKKNSKTITISSGKKKNTYTKDSVKYQYSNTGKTVTKTAGYKSYINTVSKETMVEYNTLATLVNIKLYSAKNAGEYQKAGYSGVLCLSKYHKVTKLPAMEEGTRVSTEEELFQAAIDLTINNIIITNNITVIGDFSCEREESPVNIHIQKGKTLTINQEYLEVGGTLKNDGTMIVKGSMTRGICNMINNGAFIIENGGIAGSGMSDLNNNGSVIIKKGGSLLVDRGSAFYNYGKVDNTGSISIKDGGSFNDKGGKTVNNGIIDLYSYYNGDITLITGEGTLNDYREAAAE